MVLQAVERAPNGIRTRVATLKGWSPGPLDDGDCLAVGDAGEHSGRGACRPVGANRPGGGPLSGVRGDVHDARRRVEEGTDAADRDRSGGEDADRVVADQV